MQEESLDLRSYWRVFLRWWWIFAIAIVAPVLYIYVSSEDPIPVYQATAKVLVESRQAPGVPSSGDLQNSQALAESYKDFVLTRTVLERAAQKLGPPYQAGAIPGKLSISTTRTLILVSGRDTDPVVAAQIANAMANSFIEDQRDRQLTQIASFAAALSQYGLNQGSDLVAAQVASLRSLSILEEAVPSYSSITRSNESRSMIMAAIIGLLAAIALAYVLEHLDESLRSQDELKALTGLPVLGAVLWRPKSADQGQMLVWKATASGPESESYKFIRTNLDFIALDSQGLNSLMVTSSSPQEGKTTISANLAISAANEGKSVVLIDGDLRRPSLHKLFQINSSIGLTTVLLGGAPLEKALYSVPDLPGLKVLPAGPLPVDPTPVLRSRAMKDLVARLKATNDLIIIDTGPALAVTDPLVLATLVDAVVLVVAAHSSRRSAIKQMVATMRQANPKVMGTVVNKVRHKAGSYYYHYYHQYYYSSNGSYGKRGLSSKLAGLFGRKRTHAPNGKGSPVPAANGASPNGAAHPVLKDPKPAAGSAERTATNNGALETKDRR